MHSGASTKSGSSTSGTFTANLTGLNGSTTYYFRAYATNEAGTQYGTSKSFTTQALGPCEGATTYTFDGHTYPLVEAGGECWFGEDVQATTGFTETDLNSPPDCPTWDPCLNPFYAIDEAGGILYDALAKNGPACPSGWHSANNSDWTNAGSTTNSIFLSPPSSLELTLCSVSGGQTLSSNSYTFIIQPFASYWNGEGYIRIGSSCLATLGTTEMARVRCVKD